MPARISPRARLGIRAAAQWWREHRDKAADLFDQELAQALDFIDFAPWAGRRVEGTRLHEVRVVVLQRTGYLLFYRVGDGDSVRVLTIRHGRRNAAQP